jgi:hypothetical protein
VRLPERAPKPEPVLPLELPHERRRHRLGRQQSQRGQVDQPARGRRLDDRLRRARTHVEHHRAGEAVVPAAAQAAAVRGGRPGQRHVAHPERGIAPQSDDELAQARRLETDWDARRHADHAQPAQRLARRDAAQPGQQDTDRPHAQRHRRDHHQPGEPMTRLDEHDVGHRSGSGVRDQREPPVDHAGAEAAVGICDHPSRDGRAHG